METPDAQDFKKSGSLERFLEIDVSSAGFGEAASLGSLSVPPSWVAAGSEAEPAPLSPPAGAVDGVVDTPRWRKFQEGLMGMVTGRRGSADADDEDPTVGN
ncbi:MAG TPA: PE/PPE C-terminal domain-containing protein [Mycobacterium sp.]|nr:PE/PPE C-terminal domain-containing protein [Mycobacterium sp.]